MLLSYGLFKVWRRDLLVWSKYIGASIVANVGEPMLYLLAIGYGLGRFIGDFNGLSYVEFIAPALLVSAIMNGASFETTFSSYTRMEVQKTFHGIAVTPISVEEVVAGEILWASTKALFNSLIIFLVLLGFGLIHHPMVLALLPILFIEGILFASMGMLYTSFAKSYDFFSFYFTLFISPMFLFSGTFFPLDTLPSWLQKVAWFLPLTHAINLSRKLFYGTFQWTDLSGLLWMVVAIVVIAPLAIRRVARRLVV